MRASISLGRWFGVPVGLHYSWFVIAWLITLSLAGQFGALDANWPAPFVWALAFVTAVLFFVSIVLHELAHASVARASGMRVHGITLFALGGLAHIEKEATSPGKEFWMALAGPAASFGIGLGCRAIAGAITPPGPAASAPAAVLDWLAYINVVLALFNLVPAFPLDGGRVLRSAIWAVVRDADRATRAAARVGQAIAFVFIAGGLFMVLTRGDFGGLWLAFIGWFLLEGAQGYYQQTELSTLLRGVRVADVMAQDCVAVEADMSVRQFVDLHLLRHAPRCYAVSRNADTIGLITPDDVKAVDRSRWDVTTLSEAMRPLRSLHPVKPDAAAGEALQTMTRENIPQLPVMADGRLQGVVTLSYLVRLLHTKRELGA
jgi:Zn-dependent protease/CBS domain-containing protein